MLKLEQHNHSNSLHHLCREKLDLRAEGGLLDTETSRSVDPCFGPSTWLADKNQNAVTTLLLRKTEKLRPSGTRRCYKSSRGVLPGAGGHSNTTVVISNENGTLPSSFYSVHCYHCYKASWVKDCWCWCWCEPSTQQPPPSPPPIKADAKTFLIKISQQLPVCCAKFQRFSMKIHSPVEIRIALRIGSTWQWRDVDKCFGIWTSHFPVQHLFLYSA